MVLCATFCQSLAATFSFSDLFVCQFIFKIPNGLNVLKPLLMYKKQYMIGGNFKMIVLHFRKYIVIDVDAWPERQIHVLVRVFFLSFATSNRKKHATTLYNSVPMEMVASNEKSCRFGNKNEHEKKQKNKTKMVI